MEELASKVTDLEQGQLMSATVAMSLLVYLQELVRIMGSGLEMHQLVKVSYLFSISVAIECTNLWFNSLVRCPTLPNPTNGRVTQQGNEPGDRATYTCNSGYELDDGSTRICQTNGRWSGETPTCERRGMCSNSFLGVYTFIEPYTLLLQLNALIFPILLMGELNSKAMNQEIERDTAAIVAMSLSVNP